MTDKTDELAEVMKKQFDKQFYRMLFPSEFEQRLDAAMAKHGYYWNGFSWSKK